MYCITSQSVQEDFDVILLLDAEEQISKWRLVFHLVITMSHKAACLFYTHFIIYFFVLLVLLKRILKFMSSNVLINLCKRKIEKSCNVIDFYWMYLGGHHQKKSLKMNAVFQHCATSTMPQVRNSLSEMFLFWGAVLPTAVLAHKHSAQLKHVVEQCVLHKAFHSLKVILYASGVNLCCSSSIPIIDSRALGICYIEILLMYEM